LDTREERGLTKIFNKIKSKVRPFFILFLIPHGPHPMPIHQNRYTETEIMMVYVIP